MGVGDGLGEGVGEGVGVGVGVADGAKEGTDEGASFFVGEFFVAEGKDVSLCLQAAKKHKHITTISKQLVNFFILPSFLFLFFRFYRKLLKMPDIFYILFNGSVGRELTAFCYIQNRRLSPLLLVPVHSLYSLLSFCIRTEIL